MKTIKGLYENQKLAINGGQPVRKKPFASSCFMSGNEIELVLDCLKSNQWSAFKGAAEGWDIKKVCCMSSREAVKYGSQDIRFLGGRYVRKLEALFAKRFKVKYAISANSGTSCLVMALGALGLGPGDEVIVPCMSFNATATSVLYFNSIPVFAEIKPDTFCLDPKDIERKISKRTKAIVVVHLGGNSADMEPIIKIARRHKLGVIEDAAQAIGATYNGRALGTIGNAGIYSLTETKHITCGEGGVLITDDPAIAFKARLIRNHGEGVAEETWTNDRLVNVIGMNFRLTEIQAAVAIPQLGSLDRRNKIREQNTAYLIKKLRKYKALLPPQVEKGSRYICFMLKWRYIRQKDMPDRDWLVKALIAEGIPVSGGYARLMHENPIFSKRIAYGAKGCPYSCSFYRGTAKYGPGVCPRSEVINKQFIWFKYINPPNTKRDMDDVVAAFEKVLG
ncbi:MAG TPA: DegT/DnrJ/EryC1/StrS family aminotransferase [Candidatus Omnitrophica bacterium]|nr:DegT/DnrJ/EryC1/StrS family aminotransferase [Candidatus Omnitrophota bacterium]